MSEQPTETVETNVAPPPFDPDPKLVGDAENNWFALRDFRKAAKEAHEAAEQQRSRQ